MSAAPAPEAATGAPAQDLGASAARGTGVTLVTQALRAVLQFGSVVVLARLLTPQEFGLVAMVAAVIGVAEVIRDFGLSSAAIQSATLADAEQTNLFWVNTALGAGCAAVAVAARPLVVAAYDEPRLGPIVMALAGTFVLSGLNTQFRTDLTRRMRFGALAASDVASQVAGVAVAIALALAGAGLWALIAQQLVTAVVSLVMNVANSPFRPGPPHRQVSIRRFFRFGLGLLATQTIAYGTKNVDDVAVGAVFGAGPLGLYNRAYQLLMTPLNQINAPMTRVALPVLSRVQDDEATYARYLARVQLVACYLTATVFAVAAALADPVVRILFGDRWTSVAPIFAVLAIGGIFRAVSQISYWIYLSRGRTGAQLRMFLVTRPIMIAIILAGLPWGPVGVAAGHSVAYCFFWVASLAHVGRVTGVDTRPLFRNALRAILLVSLPCGAVAALGPLLPVPPVLQVVAGLALAAAYLVAVSATVPAVRADSRTVLAFARRALARRRPARG